MIDANERKHNNIVDLVEQEMLNRGHLDVYKFVLYDRGELDAYASLQKYILLFEIKGRYTNAGKNKAIKQLNRAERFYFNHDYRVFKFFVYSDNEGIKYNWIKN